MRVGAVRCSIVITGLASARSISYIVRDGQVVAFVEVKTRRKSSFASAKEAVGTAKIERITKASLEYLNEIGGDDYVRFDVIGIEVSKDGSFEVEYIKDAFEVSG